MSTPASDHDAGTHATPVRRKVVLSTDSYFPLEGGAERQLRLALSRLPHDRFEVVVVARRLAGAADHEQLDGLRVERVGPVGGGAPGAARYSLAAARAIARERPDAVVAIQSGSSALAAVLARVPRWRRQSLFVRLTGMGPHGTDLESQSRSPLRRLVGRVVLGAATEVVAPAELLLDRSGRFQRVVDRKRRVVPNGADAPASTRAPDDVLPTDVVWVGRDHGPKGLPDLLALAEACPDLSFAVVGPDPAGLAPLPNLRAPGWVTDPSPYVAAARLFVSTSIHEGSPNAAIEALAAGRPVVAWAIPAFEELVSRTGSGVRLVPIADSVALERAVRAMLADPPEVGRVPSLDDATRAWEQLLDPDGPKPGQSLRILFTVGSLQVGGSETQAVRTAVELSRRGDEVRVLALQSAGPLAAELDDAGVPWDLVVVPPLGGRDLRGIARGMRRVWTSVRAFRPDVVHAWAPTPALLSMPVAWAQRVPARVVGRRALWDSLNFRRRPVQWLHGVALRLAHVVVANSAEVASDTRRHGRVPEHKLRVIGNGVELPAERAPVGDSPAVGVLAARFRPEKAHVDLVRALGRLTHPPTVRFVGDGPEREAIEKAIAEEGVGDSVVFEGMVDRAADRFATAQFGVLCSRSEGLPNAVLEAFAWGVPVVATSVGGVVDLVVDGVNGLLVPPADPEALAAALDRLASDAALRARLGAAARATAESFSWERCLDEHVRLYRAAGGGRRRGTGRG